MVKFTALKKLNNPNLLNFKNDRASEKKIIILMDIFGILVL